MKRTLAIICLVSVLSPAIAHAGVGSATLNGLRKFVAPATGAAGREATEQLGRHAVVAGAREATEAAAKQSAALAARQFPVAANATADFADDFARAYARLSPQASRRFAQLAPELEQAGASASVVKRLGSVNNADDYIEMLWRHKGKIAAAAATGALVLHGDAVVETAGEHLARPMIEGVAAPIGRGVGYVVIPTFAIVGLLAIAALLHGGPSAYRIKRLAARIRERRRQVR